MNKIKRCERCNNIVSAIASNHHNTFRTPKRCVPCREHVRSLSHGKRNLKRNNEIKQEQRLFALAIYSNNNFKCYHCGYDNMDALCIDHINNDGSKHRKEMNGTRIETWLKQNNYPTGFQILCFNCNHLKRIGCGK